MRTSFDETAAVYEEAISRAAISLAAEKSMNQMAAADKRLTSSGDSQSDDQVSPEPSAPQGSTLEPSRKGFPLAKLMPVNSQLGIGGQLQPPGAGGVSARFQSPMSDVSMDLGQWTQAASLAWQWTNTIRKELEAAQCSNVQLQAEVAKLREVQIIVGACGASGDSEGAVRAMLAQCREELAKEKAASENLRHYYGCGRENLKGPESGAHNTADSEPLERAQREVTELKATIKRQVEQIAQLTLQLAEAKAETALPSGGGVELRGDQRGVPGGPAASEVDLLRVQVAALKEIVSIQEEGVLRKAQRGGGALKEDKPGREPDLENRNMGKQSESSERQDAAGGPSEKDPSQADIGGCRGDDDVGGEDEKTVGGIQYVKALLGRWREEVYALVLESKEREWEVVREAAKVGRELDTERGLREEKNTRCKVLEQRAISLTAELQIQRDAAERGAQSLSTLQKEHATAKAALTQADSAIRLLWTAVQQWQRKEDAGLQKLAESERLLDGFARRLRFAEERLVFGRELGGGKREGRGREAGNAGTEGPSVNRSEFSLQGVLAVGSSGQSHLQHNKEGQAVTEVQPCRMRIGDSAMRLTEGEASGRDPGRMTGVKNRENEMSRTDCTVTGRKVERAEWPLVERGQVEQSRGDARRSIEGESELEAEVERLQRERAMLVGRVRQLEGGAELTSLTARREELEAQLTGCRERADTAAERAANLEELLASARASLAREGETVEQLQARVRDLESSSKKALARELRRAEEQARADLAAAAEAHETESAALRARVAALERENAKAAVNLRQLERQAAQVKEQKTHERDARISELECRLERQDADLRSVRRERSVLLAQLRKLERDAHARKRGIGEGGLHAEVVRTPAPRSERKPLVESERNGAVGGTRGGSPGEYGWPAKKSLLTVAAGVAMSKQVGSPGLDGGLKESFAESSEEGSEKDRELESLFLGGKRPLNMKETGGVGLNDPGITTPPHKEEESLETPGGPAQRRRVSEVLDESGHDLMLRLNKLAQLSNAILDGSVGQ